MGESSIRRLFDSGLLTIAVRRLCEGKPRGNGINGYNQSSPRGAARSRRKSILEIQEPASVNDLRPQETWRGVMGDRMTILLSVVGMAFVAFAIWLGVQIINWRERSAIRGGRPNGQ